MRSSHSALFGRPGTIARPLALARAGLRVAGGVTSPLFRSIGKLSTASSPKKRKADSQLTPQAMASAATQKTDSKERTMQAVRVHVNGMPLSCFLSAFACNSVTSATVPCALPSLWRAGGPEALKVDTIPVPAIAPNQVLVKVAVAGVNFIDTYQRKGMYPVKLPHILGREAAGVVEAVGYAHATTIRLFASLNAPKVLTLF